MKGQSIIIGAVAGLAAGALIGILFAPDKGTEVRHAISKKSGEYLDSVKKGFNSFVDGFTGRFAEAKDEVSDAARKTAGNVRRETQPSA
jgi:gas vesicle protein